jgi:threonine synthase
LPAPLPSPPGLAAAAGGTPLFRDEGLDSFVGASVHLKLEGQQPTGSFKDRGSALAGAKQLVADGILTEDDDVAVVATGTGLTEASADVSAPAVDLAALDGRLAEFAGR